MIAFEEPFLFSCASTLNIEALVSSKRLIGTWQLIETNEGMNLGIYRFVESLQQHLI